MATTSPVSYRFGTFELQPEERRLLSEGAPVALGPRALDLLVTLVERDGRLITKDELLERVWPRVVVEANALQSQISALRKILGADAIATVSGSGYRFTLNVSRSLAQPTYESLPKNNLPQPVTSFIGREREMAQIRLLLGRTRLLTLTGAGGCGKTRLAIQTAQRLLESGSHGVWFVEFAAVADPGLVPNLVAAALGLKEQQGKRLAQMIAQHLVDTRALVVLDNAEHLVEAVAALADELLRHCEDAVFLVTSRQKLGVAGEMTYRVPSLSVPDPKRDTTLQRLVAFESVQLFVDRARLQRPHFAVTAEIAPALASICHQLDGIPLAIELVAPRVRAMSVEEVNRRLDQRFGLLTTGPRTASHRQRTLRALVDWSYDLLSDAEQALLCRASVFAGGWSLEAAEQVCVAEGSDPAGTLDLLASLADKNLVLAEENDGVTRYRMLETIRQYARDRLDEGGAGSPWRTRHLRYYLAMAADTVEPLRATDTRPWFDRLEMEHDNMRAALAWCSGAGAQPAEGLRLANALGPFWIARGYVGEAVGILVRLLDATGSAAEPAARAMALNIAGHCAYYRSELEAAQSFYDQSLALRDKHGDLNAIVHSFSGLGITAGRRGDYASAQAFHQQSMAISRQLGNRRAVSDTLNNLATIAGDLGEFAKARGLHEESLAIRRELGDREGIAASLLNLSAIARDQGDYADARAKCEESLRLSRELRNPWHVAWCTMQMGLLANDQGDSSLAEVTLNECLPSLVELGDQWAMTLVLEGLANAGALANGPRAARLWGAVERLRENSGTPRTPTERSQHECQVAVARAALGDDVAFDLAWQEGRAMCLQQAVDIAIETEAARQRTS